MRKFNLVKSLTRVINNITSLPFKEGLGLGRMLILCLSIAVFGVNEAWGAWSGSGQGELHDGVWYVLYGASGDLDPRGGSAKHNLSGPGAELTFQAKKSYWSGVGDLIVTESVNDKEVYRNNPGTSWEESGKKQLNVNSIWLNFRTGSAATYRRLYQNANVTMATYFEDPSEKTLEFGSENIKTGSVSQNFTIAWCNIGEISYNLSANSDVYSVSITNNASAGHYGTATVTVTYNRDIKAGPHNATLTLTSGSTNKTISLKGTTTKRTPSMSWWSDENPKTISIEDGPITDLVTDLPERCDYNLSVSEDGYITIDNTAKTITPIASTQGKYIILTATVDNDYYYGQITKNIAVTDLKSQTIEWDQSFNNLKVGDAAISLTATAKTAITYQSSNTDVITINGNTMSIVGKGTAYVVATAAADAEYAQAMAQKAVIVRNPGESCAPYEETSGTFRSGHDLIMQWDFPATSVSYTITKPTNVLATRQATIDEWYDNAWHNVTSFAPANKGTSDTRSINIKSRKIRVTSQADKDMIVNSLRVDMTQYLNLSTSSLTMTATTTSSAQNSFAVDYSNIQGPLEYTSDNPYISFSPLSGTQGDCGEWGSAAINVIYAPAEVQDKDYTITIWDGKTESLKKTITVHCKSTATAQTMTWNQTFGTYKTTETIPAFTATTDAVRTDENTYPVVYTSLNPSIASITGNQLTILSGGEVTVRASQDGKDAKGRQRYTSVYVDKTITIEKVNPVVTFPTAKTITYGTALSNDLLIGGTASVSGSFVWDEVGQIKSAGTKAYNVTFTPDNIGWYNTITQPVTITINKANQTLTWDVESPIRIKKEDGNYTLTASSTSGRTITYTISNTELATINGNILTPIKSGNCKITAICPADGDYNASNAIEKQLLIAGPDEIVWKYKNGDRVWAGQNLNADGKLATAHNEVWFGKDETQWYLTVDNTTDPKTVYTAIASDGALVTISATTAGDDYYASVSSSIQVYIDRCYQGLNWDQSFVSYTATAEGQIDETIPLTAVAVDSLNKSTNLPIVYSVDNSAVAEITGNATNGWNLHIKGAGNATLTASVAQTNIYQGVTDTRQIIVRKEGERCGSYVLISTGEKKISDINDNTYTFDKPGETLTFKTRKYSILTLNADVTVQGWNYRTNTWEHIDTYNLNNTDKSTKTYTINEDFRKIKMFTGADIENSYRYISDLYITQKEYLSTSVNSIEKTIYINQNLSESFTVDYSDKPYINCTINNDQLEIVRTGEDNDCGTYGTLTFTIKNKEVWDTPRELNATITLTTSVGDKIEIPVYIKVDLGATYKFTNAAGDGDWNNVKNWDYGGTTPSSLPQMINPVDIQKPVRVSSNVEVYGLNIQNDAQQGWDGFITIAPTGGLTVYNNGVLGLNDKLIIESTQESTGFFRVAPSAVNKWAAMPIATVEFATKSTLDNGANKDAQWQYFGVAVDGVKFTADYITWLYDWDETKGWVNMKDDQEHDLLPFHGYVITQYGQPTYPFHGSLLMRDVDITLTKTSGGMNGDNIFANSYPAPIDVKNFTEEDFEGNVEKVFYLFNSGSWNQWQAGQDKDNVRANSLDNTPGTYYAIPALSTKYLDDSYQTIIPPMSGVYVIANENGAKIHLRYEKHVWNAVSSNMNRPLRAPQKAQDEEYNLPLDTIPVDTVNYAARLSHRVVLSVRSAKSGNDRISILERQDDSHFTQDYDNGYDATKFLTEGITNIYTNELAGTLAISATNNVDSMFIGFSAGEDEMYELSVSSVVGEGLKLMDMQTMEQFTLENEMTYSFWATPNSDDPYRFRIFKTNKASDTPTGWDNLGNENKIWYNNQTLFISDASVNSVAEIFTASGSLIKQVTFNNNTTISTEDMPEGVYSIRVEGSVLKFFVKH